MKWIVVFLMILIIPGLHYTGFITFFKDDSSASKNWTPIPSPHLKAQTLKGDIFSLKELKGQIILLNFWASWCQPCYKEFPELINTINWAEGKIHLVAVSVDTSKKDIEKFLKWVGGEIKNHPNIHIVWDPEYEIASQFHVVKFPETFVLNKNLEIVKKQVGVFSLKEMKSFFIQLLEKEQTK